MTSYKICVLPGEGIGPEVVNQAIKVLDALPIDFELIYGDIGYETYQKLGTPLPNETIEKVKNTDATLFGAVTTPPNIPNYSSPVLGIRQYFDMYVNLRPCINDDINIVIVRENTEGLYSRVERLEDDGNKAITERIITRTGSERIIKYAFEYAKKRGYKKVTAVHKANVMRLTCGLFRKVAFEIAEDYPEIEFNDLFVDACAMQLIKNPQQFDVIVTTNMFGDILSDEASMLVGGLGVAYSGNIGDKAAMFEPVHGSAPKYTGMNRANPIATVRAARLMLEYLDLPNEAKKIENSINKIIKNNQVTVDMGGNLTTDQVGDSIVKQLGEE